LKKDKLLDSTCVMLRPLMPMQTDDYKNKLRFKNCCLLIKMLLSELLEMNHKKRSKPTVVEDIYGIIYRIYCIPENKSYIGQTFSHFKTSNSFASCGILTRCKRHYQSRNYKINQNKPLYIALKKYPPSQFQIFEETKLYKSEIARINQIEGEYMVRYNSLIPNGYNLEEIGKKESELMKILAEFHKFEIEKTEYKDKTRERRCKDVCFGTRFNIPRELVNLDTIEEELKKIKISSIKLTKSVGTLRIIVKEEDSKDNIRIYFHGTTEECIDFVEQFTDNIIITEKFYEGTYKYQNKLNKVISLDNIKKVIYGIRKSKGKTTFVIAFRGLINGYSELLEKFSFGGKNGNIEEGKKFLELFKQQTTLNPIYIENDVGDRDSEKEIPSP
jgi:hypothetical protein